MPDINKKSGVKLTQEKEIYRRLGGVLKDLRIKPKYENKYKDITFLISSGYRDFTEQINLMVDSRVKILNKSSKEDRTAFAKLSCVDIKNRKHPMAQEYPHKESMARLYGREEKLTKILYVYDISLAKDTTTNNIKMVKSNLYKAIINAYPKIVTDKKTLDIGHACII